MKKATKIPLSKKITFHSIIDPDQYNVTIYRVKPKVVKKQLGEMMDKCNRIIEIAKQHNTNLLVDNAKSIKYCIETCLSSRDLWKKAIYVTHDGSYMPNRVLLNFVECSSISAAYLDIKEYKHDGYYEDEYMYDNPHTIKFITDHYDFVIFQFCYKSLFDYMGDYDYGIHDIYYIPNRDFDEINNLYGDIIDSIV